MKRCLHIMFDEKIINRTIKMFEMVYPYENTYYVIRKGEIHHVLPAQNVFFIEKDSQYQEILDVANGYKYIVFHALHGQVVRHLKNLRHPNICWIEWGYDLYNQLLIHKGFELFENPSASKLLLDPKLPFVFAYIKSKIRGFYYQKIVRNFVKKVHYFMPDSTPDELPLLLNYYPEFSHLEHKDIFYYPIDEILGNELMEKRCNGNAIFVNHSAYITGNHIGVYKKLASLGVDNRIVYSPISYGPETCKSYIKDNGYNILGDNFVPLENYMPLEKYNKLLLSANVFIYGHWRQEAVGNILTALYLGGKVFLYQRNPMYKYYRRLGLIIFSIEEMSKELISLQLDTDSVNNNRAIINKMYSKERLLELIKVDFE